MRWLGHLDTLSALADFARLTHRDPWKAKPDCQVMTFEQEPHKTLLLRCQKNASFENFLDDLPMFDSSEYEKLKSLRTLVSRARKIIFADPMLSAALDATAPVGRVVISVLAPKSVMRWHSDLGDYAKKHVRFHVPLQTNPGAQLYCGPQSMHLPVGALVVLDVLQQHCAANFGDTPRSHLIFELRRRDAEEAA